MTLALTGSSYDETEPRKTTYLQAGRNAKSLTSLEFIPAEPASSNGKSPGNPVVELATSNGTTPRAATGETPEVCPEGNLPCNFSPATQWLINLSEGTKKNELWVLRRSNLR
ncbi:MAG: hypothetical protein EAZ77_17395 [Nostocales cyanobacterium]|nr:MAG: hypothetical protein EAZ77_17395 [Nostocales cyanobacterium]